MHCTLRHSSIRLVNGIQLTIQNIVVGVGKSDSKTKALSNFRTTPLQNPETLQAIHEVEIADGDEAGIDWSCVRDGDGRDVTAAAGGGGDH